MSSGFTGVVSVDRFAQEPEHDRTASPAVTDLAKRGPDKSQTKNLLGFRRAGPATWRPKCCPHAAAIRVLLRNTLLVGINNWRAYEAF